MGSSKNKHLLEIEPRGAYLKNSPTWGHFLNVKKWHKIVEEVILIAGQKY